MEVTGYVAIIIAGTAIVTLLPRVLPLMLLSRAELPEWALRWLKYVPIAVIAALIGQALFAHDGEVSLLSNYVQLIAVVPALWVAITTRSLLFTVIIGMASVMLLRML